MKSKIHPTYYKEAKVHCACGAAFTIGSTSEDISVELCSQCHPFYTGKQKLMDTARRVEKFEERKGKTAVATRGGKQARMVKRAKQKVEKRPKMEVEQA